MNDASSASPSSDLPTSTPASRPPRPGRRRRLWPWLLAAVLAGGMWFVHARLSQAAAQSSAQASGSARGGAGAAARAVPVQSAKVTRGDVNVYLSGLIGTATALNTVTVRTRVDGQLVSVGFREGQFVHEGDAARRDRSAAIRRCSSSRPRGSCTRTRRNSRTRSWTSNDIRSLFSRGLRPEAAARHAAGDGDAGRRRHRDRPGTDRQRAKLNLTYCRDHRADQRAHRPAPRRRGQHRPRRRPEWPARDHRGSADRRRLHRFPRTACRACFRRFARATSSSSTPSTAIR